MHGPLLIGFGAAKPSLIVPLLRAALKTARAPSPSFTSLDNVDEVKRWRAGLRVATADSVNDLIENAGNTATSEFAAILCFDSPIMLMAVSDLIPQDFDPRDKWTLPATDHVALPRKLAALSQSILERYKINEKTQSAPVNLTVSPVLSLVEVVERNTKPSLIGPMSGLLYSMQPAERTKVRASVAHWLMGKTTVQKALEEISAVAKPHAGSATKSLEDLRVFLLGDAKLKLPSNHETYEKEFSAKKSTNKTSRKGITVFEAEFLRRLVAEHKTT